VHSSCETPCRLSERAEARASQRDSTRTSKGSRFEQPDRGGNDEGSQHPLRIAVRHGFRVELDDDVGCRTGLQGDQEATTDARARFEKVDESACEHAPFFHGWSGLDEEHESCSLEGAVKGRDKRTRGKERAEL